MKNIIYSLFFISLVGCQIVQYEEEFDLTMKTVRSDPHIYSALKKLCHRAQTENKILCSKVEEIKNPPKNKIKDYFKGMTDYPENPTKVPIF